MKMQNERHSAYSGTSMLFAIEAHLERYNAWIMDSILRGIGGKRLARMQKVLDFGAGIGTLAGIFEQKTGVKPDGLEIDDAQRALLIKRGYKTYDSLDTIVEKFDLIFTSNVLEHIEKDVETLRLLKGKLIEGGVLAIYVPAFRLIWSSMDDKVGHYRRYTKAELSAKLNQAGFIVSHINYCDTVGFFLSLLFRFIGGSSGEPSLAALAFFDKFLLPLSKFLDYAFHPLLGKNVLAIAVPRK
jgi:SAM-dependent methyltransferase